MFYDFALPALWTRTRWRVPSATVSLSYCRCGSLEECRPPLQTIGIQPRNPRSPVSNNCSTSYYTPSCVCYRATAPTTTRERRPGVALGLGGHGEIDLGTSLSVFQAMPPIMRNISQTETTHVLIVLARSHFSWELMDEPSGYTFCFSNK